MKKDEEHQKQLKELRKHIHDIDDDILELLGERGKTVIEIGKVKQKLGLDVFQPEREEKVIEKVFQRAKVFPKESIEAIWREIISASKVIQGSIDKIGFLGPKGTFTHQAALEFFPKAGSKFIPRKSIIEIFENVEKGIMEYGVIPIENSLQGTVRETLDLLIEKNLMIYGELELRIVQNLITIPGADIEHIQRVYSHPQAFGQARSWLKANLPGAEIINTNSTAEAIKIVRERNQKENAAMGTKFACDVYGLKVLSSHIEDHPSNYTRFLVISTQQNELRNENVKTSIVYVTKHKPGALYRVLELFAKANINLLKIESRPRRKGRWEYIFLMDFVGDKSDSKVQEVLNKMEKNVIWYKVLGTYPIYQS